MRVGPGIYARSNGMGFETDGDTLLVEGSGPGTVLTTTGSAGNPTVLASSPGLSTAVRRLTVRAQPTRSVSGISGFSSISDVRFDGGRLDTALRMGSGGSISRVVMDTDTLFRGIDTDTPVVGYMLKVEDVAIRLNKPPPPTTNAAALTLGVQGTSAQATVRHVTVVGDASSGTTGLSAVANRSLDGTVGGTLTVGLRDSLLVGVRTPISRIGSSNPCTPCALSNLGYRYSSLDATLGFSSGGGTVTPGPGNLPSPNPVLSPAFVPLPGSPLIDAGDPAAPEAGDSGLDAGGGPRIVGGRRDIGALEHTPPPGGGAVPAPAGAGARLDTTAPSLTRVRLTNRRFRVGRKPTAVTAAARKRRRAPAGTIVRFRSTEPAAALLTFERRLKGSRVTRRSKVVCVKRKAGTRKRACTLFRRQGTLRRRAAAGTNAIAFTGRIGSRRLPVGRYRLIVTATDAAGNAARSRPMSFSVVR